MGSLSATATNTVNADCSPFTTSYKFEIVGGEVDRFNILLDNGTYYLRLTQNNERSEKLEVVVRVTDGRGLTYDEKLTVRWVVSVSCIEVVQLTDG